MNESRRLLSAVLLLMKTSVIYFTEVEKSDKINVDYHMTSRI